MKLHPVNLFGEARPIDVPTPKRPMSQRINPMVKAFGLRPEGGTCRRCAFLYYHGSSSKRFYKCDLRGRPTYGKGTDHLVNWPACSKYKEGNLPT
jgi:hypothetical protein